MDIPMELMAAAAAARATTIAPHSLGQYWSESEGSAAPWEDPQFPASWRALGERRLAAGLRWMRPHELCARPRFRGDDATAGGGVASDAGDPEDEPAARWCVQAGELSGAEACCAAAALALTPRLLERVAPPHSFSARYNGRFRFNFWVFGEWREVAVDDRLPTRGGRLLCSRSALADDFTLPLLEKAYAKLYGSYAALRGGGVARALQDLTGGIVQSFSLRHMPRHITLRALDSAAPRSTLLVATVQDGARDGLLPGQAYCVTGLARVRDPPDAAMLRLRAVGGRGVWTGARALGEADAEPPARGAPSSADFWMPFGEFARSFARLELVHVGPDDWLAEPALRGRRPWRAALARRRWRSGCSAGGPPSAPTAFANPQFHVEVARRCRAVVAVTQQYRAPPPRRPRPSGVGFALYELPPGAEPRRPADRALLARLRPLDATHSSRAREAVTFLTLPPGRYLVMPHARRAHAEAAFLLRILTDERTDVWEVNEDNVIVRDVAAEFAGDPRAIPAEVRATVGELFAGRESEEVDAAGLRAALRRVRRGYCARPSLELCRALLALRDAPLAGAVSASDVPALVALLAYWRAAFLRHAPARCGRSACSYALRALLWESGVTASNKVLEGLVLRFARGRRLSAEGYALALARLHLAHERYRSLDAKLKSNPLSLEEMILMTIYS